VLFKLVPWEWLINDKEGQELGPVACNNMLRSDGTIWIEPIWKMLWSNKAILPILWELFKDDPEKSKYLLPAYFEDERPPGLVDYVRKPILGREGANVVIFKGNEPSEEGEDEGYGAEGSVVQTLYPLPGFESSLEGTVWHPVLGVYTVQDDGDVGLIIRESDGLITNNLSYCIPHIVTGI
jgi:glutathionylspermidine synthase